MEQGFFLRHKKELGASIKRTIIINISFIIHIILERAFANFLKKYITILFTGIFIWFFRGVFLRKFCLLTQKTTFLSTDPNSHYWMKDTLNTLLQEISQ